MKITKEQFKNIVKEVMTEENEYQAFFAKALEKTGKSIPDMSDEEKKAFFDKIDSAWNGKGEKSENVSVNEAEEIKWNAVENAIINFLKANTKILDKRVKDKDTEGVKGGLQSIIDGLTNAQRSLKLK